MAHALRRNDHCGQAKVLSSPASDCGQQHGGSGKTLAVQAQRRVAEPAVSGPGNQEISLIGEALTAGRDTHFLLRRLEDTQLISAPVRMFV